MKKITLIISFILCATVLFAQSDKYSKAMKANIAAIDTSFKNPANLLSLSNTFERIALAEKNQWLPFYYAALLQVNYGFMMADKSKVDPVADKAEQLIAIADSLSPKNSEISTVKSMVASCRLMVNPMARYMEYGPISQAQINLAMQQDSTNPRPYYLLGESLKYTPENFGGGCATAKQPLEIARLKFTTFKPLTDLHPAWGQQRTTTLLADCMK